MRRRASQVVLLALCASLPAAQGGDADGARVIQLKAVTATQPVAEDADDPALWVHRGDRSRSLIIGTDKAEGPNGAIYAFTLDGKIVQKVSGLDRPNNVDVRQGVRMNGRLVDLAVATERRKGRLRVFSIRPNAPYLTDVTGNCKVFEGETGDRSEPMGIALYHRRTDGALFAIVSRKSGPTRGYLGQYRLQMDSAGKVHASLARTFGDFSGSKEIEAVCADDVLGYVFYSDEGYGVRKYHANPDAPGAEKELASFARTGYQGDHEGLAIISTGAKTGYLVSTEQIAGSSRYHLYLREGMPGRPHAHSLVAVLRGNADDTDGIEATSLPMGSSFPHGLLVAMNSKGKNFLLFQLPRLPLRSASQPRP